VAPKSDCIFLWEGMMVSIPVSQHQGGVGVLGTRAIFFCTLLLLLSGCATTQKLSDDDRRKIATVRINSAVQKTPEMFYMGPGAGVFMLFGAIGGAALAAASAGPAEAIQDFAEKKGIFIEKIAFEEIDAAIRQSGKLKVLNSGEPTDAVVNVIVYHYGFAIPHGFSSRLGPVIGIRCEMMDAAGKVLGTAYDFVVKSPVETMTLEEMRDDPTRIASAWRAAAKLVARNIAREFGYGGSSPQPAVAAIAPPAASAAAPAAPATHVMASTQTSASREGMPAAGSQWVYGFIDRQFGRRPIDVTVRAERVAGTSVDEAVISGRPSAQETQRSVSAGESRFFTHRLADDAELTEFAPYFLAANGEKASTLAITAAGYPVGAGNPSWITQTQPPTWEQVTVPAGTFKALRLEISGKRARSPFSSIVTYRFKVRIWYAPEVQRYVRLEHIEWLSDRQASDVVVELVKFSPPP
jgi:hypothetical protein